MSHPETEALVRLVSGEGASDPKMLSHVLVCPQCGRKAAELAAQGIRRMEPQGWRSVERIWRQVAALQARAEEEMERDRKEAMPLFKELLGMRLEEQREAVASEPRFHSLGLARMLLDTGAAAVEIFPDMTEDLAYLALEAAAGTAGRTSDSLRRETQARAWMRIADARRRQADLEGAEEAFGRARVWLEAEPLDDPVRAELCRLLALLRRDQERLDEALGLLARAAALADETSQWDEAGLARIAEGWTRLEEGDPQGAVWPFEMALGLFEPWERPHFMLRAYHGLALAHADLGDRETAQRLLEKSRRVHGCLGSSAWSAVLAAEARVEERCGRWAEAVAKLEEAVPGLVRGGVVVDAAIAGVRLAQLYGEQRQESKLPALARRLEPALRAPAVSLRARTLTAALIRLASRGTEHLPGLFEESAAWLERARHNPDLPLPPRGGAYSALPWDDLNRSARRKVCARIGFPQDFSLRPVETIESEVRDVMTWIHEALTHIRIGFEVR